MWESDASSYSIVSGTCLRFCEPLGEAEPRVAVGCLPLDELLILRAQLVFIGVRV
jgi:hypothetical protein